MMVPTKASPPNSLESRANPVPASSTSRGFSSSSARTAMHEVLPPYRTNSGPGAGVEPRTPQTSNRTYRTLPTLFFTVSRRQLGERLLVDLVAGSHRHLHSRQCPQRERALPAFEDGALAENGAGAELVDLLAVELGRQHTVEEQEDVVAF